MKALLNTILGRPAPGFKVLQNENGYYRAFHPDIDELYWFYGEPVKSFRKAVYNTWQGYQALGNQREGNLKRAGGWKEV